MAKVAITNAEGAEVSSLALQTRFGKTNEKAGQPFTSSGGKAAVRARVVVIATGDNPWNVPAGTVFEGSAVLVEFARS